MQPENPQLRFGVKSHTTNANPRSQFMILGTARIILSSTQQRTSRARALINPCSEASFISEVLVKRLKLQLLPCLTGYVPSAQATSPTLSFSDGHCLADTQPEAADQIYIILGAYVYTRIIEEGLHKSSDASTIAQATAFGWIITGRPIAFEE
ncbi:hypothetical protein TSAR_008361 [Trichomalopsis sarcophagae]|uniref:Peptidase aspartic putative domain-containing protein n=1 Tax=Trichomalopsis sarcophagae TaxID=543379 RepID=A0A232EV96_9HYME|nr:hypothetical protein TSAR_008361 [Trichomalopsis sarcophagae]